MLRVPPAVQVQVLRRHIHRLDALLYVDAQIAYCFNGRCALRFKPLHPPEELALAPQRKGYGFDVIAHIGQVRFREKWTRSQIKEHLGEEFPQLVISPREIENLFKLYGELVSGATLEDPELIKVIKRNGAMVLGFDGAKPLKDHESVWFVRDLVSGVTLAARAMRSCTDKGTGQAPRVDQGVCSANRRACRWHCVRRGAQEPGGGARGVSESSTSTVPATLRHQSGRTAGHARPEAPQGDQGVEA